MRTFVYFLTSVLAAALTAPASGQTTPKTLDDWLAVRINAAIDKALVGVNGKEPGRQRETPSVADRSTSLVDHGSGTDFISTAINVVPVGNFRSAAPGASGSSPAQGAGSVTAAAYSLLSALTGTSPTDPDFYRRYSNARKFSFTVGRAASTKSEDNTEEPGTVLGFKFTPVNQRDLYSRTGQRALKEVQEANAARGTVYGQLKDQIEVLLYYSCKGGTCTVDERTNEALMTEFQMDRRKDIPPAQEAPAPPPPAPPAPGAPPPPPPFAAEFARVLTPITTDFDRQFPAFPKELQNRIDALIDAAVPRLQKFREVVEKAYDAISKGKQLAFSYQVVKRDEFGNDDHRAQLVWDYGLTDSVTWTVNGGADYRNRKHAEDNRGGRVATEFLGRLTRQSESPFGRLPLMLSLSGEGKWLTRMKPQYSVQAKLTVPVAAGVELPVVYRWVSRPDLLDRTASEAHLGLSFDIARLAQGLR